MQQLRFLSVSLFFFFFVFAAAGSATAAKKGRESTTVKDRFEDVLDAHDGESEKEEREIERGIK